MMLHTFSTHSELSLGERELKNTSSDGRVWSETALVHANQPAAEAVTCGLTLRSCMPTSQQQKL